MSISSLLVRLQRSPSTWLLGLGSFFGLFSFFGYRALGLCRRTQKQITDSEEVIRSLKSQLLQREEEISLLQQSISTAQALGKVNEAEATALKVDLGRTRGRLEEAVQQVGTARSKLAAAEESLRREAQSAKQVRDEVQRLMTSQAQMSELLQTRTQEWESAQTFLGTSDAYSGAEVTKMVQELNSEILQTAAFMAESFEFKSKSLSMAESTPEVVNAMENIAEFLGVRMTEVLRRSDHRNDPSLVQMCFQAGMCAYAEWIIRSWSFQEADSEKILSIIYENVRQTEEQRIAGRWRALTRAHAQRALQDTSEVQSFFLDAFAKILVCAGVDSSEEEIRNAVINKFGERIDSVIQSAIRLNKVVGEKVVSCEMIPVYSTPDSEFEATEMEDAFGEQDAGGHVLCTTDLGLWRAEKVNGQWKETALLKPKVVLQTVLDDL